MGKFTPNSIIKLACLFCVIDRRSQGVEIATVAAGLKRLNMGFERASEQVSEYAESVANLSRVEYIDLFTGAVFEVYEEYGSEDYKNFFALLCDIAVSDKNVHITELRELDRIADLWGIPIKEREEIIEEARKRFKVKN